jgi:hypothetical protein
VDGQPLLLGKGAFGEVRCGGAGAVMLFVWRV